MSDKILVVDDEPNIRETVSYILQEEGYDVLTACDGDQALRLIRQEKPRVVLLDRVGPRRSRDDVRSLLQNDPEMKAIPIVMLTSGGQVKEEAPAWQSGADRFVSRTFDDQRVLESIEEYFEKPT